MSKLTKSTLTKGETGLSLGSIEKEPMPKLKEDLSEREQRTTLYLNTEVYKAAKLYAISNGLTLKNYFNDLLYKDLSEKGIIK